MKKVLQSLKTGATEVVDVPVPAVKRGQLLISTTHSLVSAGTERMLVDFGKAGWIKKARQQPDKVRLVLEKIKTDGFQPTIESVLQKLDQPLPLGYCNIGRVAKLGSEVSGFKLGDRVISNGGHAELVGVPINLCARVPDSVPDEAAVFTVLGAIALQGLRLVRPTLGEAIVVTGLGVIGLLAVQLLRANGCRVLALDFDKEKLKLAQQFGAEVVDLGAGQNPLHMAEIFSRGRGVDAVVVTASTKSSEPMHQAALMCRKRGRIILVGVAGLELARDDFYKKELTFQVSASYGPGRYDPNYEEKGHDYPLGFVRWTARRNFEAVLDMMAEGRIDVQPLISHRFEIEEADRAYEVIANSEPSLGILLRYPGFNLSRDASNVALTTEKKSERNGAKIDGPAVAISFIGAGNYATRVLIPAFKKAGALFRTVVSNGGVSGLHAAQKFGFENAATESCDVFSDQRNDAVVIATQHDSHHTLVSTALKSGKSVFVEKPLCLSLSELEDITEAYGIAQKEFISQPILMVGFNRRFAPHIVKIRHLINEVTDPKSIVMTVNAGAIPSDHWTQQEAVGGGRIIGEACHFIDVIRFIVGYPIESWTKVAMDDHTEDTVVISLKFTDGSIAAINYFANGSRAVPKERLSVFVAGRVLQLDNYRKLSGFGWRGFKNMNLLRQDKGQAHCAKAFVEAVQEGSKSPIPLEEILEVSRVSIELAKIRAS